MITNSEFRLSVTTLKNLTSGNSAAFEPARFGKDHCNQHSITTAVKIIHKTQIHGSKEQKKELLTLRKKIKHLNKLLKDPSFTATTNHEVAGMQIRLPLTKLEKMWHTATKIPHIVFTVLFDILTLAIAVPPLLAASCKANFNPKERDVKKGKVPILLLHGSCYNESEWVIGRQFLKNKKYGSVFSMNYDNLVSAIDPKEGIDDIARSRIRKEIKRIQSLTESDEIILIGHSMGGLLAGYYAENCAKEDNISVKHVISVATPWHGAPLLDHLRSRYEKKNATLAKREQQMSVRGGSVANPEFRQKLVKQALDSERSRKRKYYSVWSTTDCAVPGVRGSLTEDPRRQRSFTHLGHYGIIAWPRTWFQTRSWLDKIYTNSPNQ